MSLEKADAYIKRFGMEACQKLVLKEKLMGLTAPELRTLGLEREDVQDINRLTLHKSLKVYNIMTPGTLESGIQTIWINDTVEKAAKELSEHGISSLIVIDMDKPVGIITERDIIQKVVGQKKRLSVCRVGYYMSAPLMTVDYDEHLDNAAYIMSKNNVKKLVVTKENKIVGIVTTTDFIIAYREIIKILMEKAKEGMLSDMRPDWK